VEIFDPSTKTFRDGPPLPLKLSNMSALTVGKLIVVIGGITTDRRTIGGSYLLNTTALDQGWKAISNAQLQNVRSDHTAVLINNSKVCICGGFDDANEAVTIETISIQDLFTHDQLKDAGGLSLPFAARNTIVTGINDTPKNSTPDRLGYATYAKALVSVAKHAEGPNSSFCVGINAPWGAGKSFLYRLIEGELRRDELLHERKKKQKLIEAKEGIDDDDDADGELSHAVSFREEFKISLGACSDYINEKIITCDPDNCCLQCILIVPVNLIYCVLIVVTVPIHLFWAQKQKFSFFEERDIGRYFMKTVQTFWEFLSTLALRRNLFRKVLSLVVLFIPLVLLALVAYVIIVVAISCFVILPYLAWLLILWVISFFEEPASDATTYVTDIIRSDRVFNFFTNGSSSGSDNKEVRKLEEANRAVKIAAILLSTSLIWAFLWIIFFILFLPDRLVEKITDTLMALCSSIKNCCRDSEHNPPPVSQEEDVWGYGSRGPILLPRHVLLEESNYYEGQGDEEQGNVQERDGHNDAYGDINSRFPVPQEEDICVCDIHGSILLPRSVMLPDNGEEEKEEIGQSQQTSLPLGVQRHNNTTRKESIGKGNSTTRNSNEQEADTKNGTKKDNFTPNQVQPQPNENPSDSKSAQDSIEKKVRNILTGTSDDDANLAIPGLSKFIVKVYLKIINILRNITRFVCCYGNTRDEEEEEEGKGMTKYICVEFSAWTYNGSDRLWKSILIEIWEAVSIVYGRDNLGGYRTGVELIRSQNGRSSPAIVDAKSLYQQRQDALQSLNTKTFVSITSASLTTIVCTINRIKPLPKDSNPILIVLYNDILLYLVLALLVVSLMQLLKNLYIYVRYVLPITQINDKASAKRQKYLGDTGFEGFVKQEFEYILDFLRYAPLPENYSKRYSNVRLSILIDDLDRCNSQTVMTILQAVILLLNDAPVTCWLALDTGLVVASIEQAMADQLDEAGMTGYEFIEKIIQLPLCIPDLDTQQKEKFISRLFVQDKLDSTHLMKLVNELEIQYPCLAIDTSDNFVHENHSFGEEAQEEEHALRVLVHRMKDVVKKKESGESLFESNLASDSMEAIQNMEDAIVKKEWQDMEKSDREDFLFLVCEWIEWFQENSRSAMQKQERHTAVETINHNTNTKNATNNTISYGNNSKDERGGKLQSIMTTNSISQAHSPPNVVENPVQQGVNIEIRPVLETMVSVKEKTWFSQYACYMSGRPRSITRIINIYNLARYLIDCNRELVLPDEFRKKLLKVIILCEHWPYRMSWLLQIAEDAMQESVLKNKEQKAEKQSQQVFQDLDYLGLKILKKGIQNYDDTKVEANDTNSKVISSNIKMTEPATSAELIQNDTKTPTQDVFKQLDNLGLKIVKNGTKTSSSSGKNDRNMGTNDDESPDNILFSIFAPHLNMPKHRRRDSVVEPLVAEDHAQETKVSTQVTQEDSTHDVVQTPAIEDYENETFARMQRLTLFNIYHLVVESLLYSSDNNKKDLSRDGDPQLFKQLISEDDCDLKLIDIALPNQFVKSLDLNSKYKSLRPYMVNMYKHTVEKTARYMGRCIIHENNDKNNKFIRPRLLVETAESYYKKPSVLVAS